MEIQIIKYDLVFMPHRSYTRTAARVKSLCKVIYSFFQFTPFSFIGPGFHSHPRRGRGDEWDADPRTYQASCHMHSRLWEFIIYAHLMNTCLPDRQKDFWTIYYSTSQAVETDSSKEPEKQWLLTVGRYDGSLMKNFFKRSTSLKCYFRLSVWIEEMPVSLVTASCISIRAVFWKLCYLLYKVSV